MRKLKLLLSAGAMLGLAVGTANADRFPPNNPGNPDSPTGVGMTTLPSGFMEVGSAYTGAMGMESEAASPFSKPNPGTVNMRVNLYVNTFAQVAWWSGMDGTGNPAAGAGNKQDPYGIYGYVRLDFGIDGMTKNGIIYGGYAQIRENTAGVTGTTGGPALAAGSSTINGQNTLYARHLWAYIGTNELGVIRLGQGYSANSLLWVGGNDEFGFGGWVGGAELWSGAVSPTWPWPDSGNEYMAARIAYLSPVIMGFDLAASFAPSNDTLYTANSCTAASFQSCPSQSASNSAADITRFRNQFEIGLRYRNTFGPVGVVASGIWTHSGVVAASASAAPGTRFNGQNIGMIGAEVSINKTLAIGGNVMFGAFNGSWGLQNKPTGAQTTVTQAVAWVAGARYTIPQVPLTIGGNYFSYKYQGQAGLATQRTSQGLEVGATYGLGPGIALIFEYAWGENRQNGFNFLAGANGAANNRVHVQTAALGMAVRF